jgi:hypothetical protein
MTEPEPSRLDKLRAVETYLQWQLERIRKNIADEEARQQQPATAWRIEHIRAVGDTATGHGILHVEGCRVGGGAVVDRDGAIVAMTEASIMPCAVCKPEAGLEG